MSMIQSVRGMNDVLPSNIYQWHYFEKTIKKILKQYNYQEMRTPIIEKSILFHKGIGTETDILQKETYNFQDFNEKSLTLRPEGTTSCARAMIEHGLLRSQPQKIWYNGAMFRYEKPQKGRYRQFHQLGVEVYGPIHISQDAELISLTWKLWKKIGLSKYITLEINNLGNSQNQSAYKDALLKYLNPLKKQLNNDDQSRLIKNPIKILDSKNKNIQLLLKDAPKFKNFLDIKDTNSFQDLINYLVSLNIPIKINPHLVRGLNYYSHTVFEWTTNYLGTQRTICAGGRYNNLVQNLNGPQIPATGFAIGIERVLLLLKTLNLLPQKRNHCDMYVISDAKSIFKNMVIIENIRQTLPKKIIEMNTTMGSLKGQLKKSKKSGAELVLIMTENTIKFDKITIKFLKIKKETVDIPIKNILQFIKKYYN